MNIRDRWNEIREGQRRQLLFQDTPTIQAMRQRWIARLAKHPRLRRAYRLTVAAVCDTLLWLMADVLPYRAGKWLERYEQAAVRHYGRFYGKNAPFEYDEEEERLKL